MNTKSDMYILCKVERCLFGSEPDEFLDVPHVIGLFDDLQTAKYSINIVWPKEVNDKDYQVSWSIAPENKDSLSKYEVLSYWYTVQKFIPNRLSPKC